MDPEQQPGSPFRQETKRRRRWDAARGRERVWNGTGQRPLRGTRDPSTATRPPQPAAGWGQALASAGCQPQLRGRGNGTEEGLHPSLLPLPTFLQAGNREQPRLAPNSAPCWNSKWWIGCSEPFGGGSTAEQGTG